MRLQQLAKLLGYAGLIPFLVFSVGSWIKLPLVDDAHFLLLTYAAIILSFMGAIHWGVALSRSDDHARLQLALSVLPALLGWLAVLISSIYSYSLLILCFVALCMADSFAAGRGLLPYWYLTMRYILTTVVVLCLLAGALSLVLN